MPNKNFTAIVIHHSATKDGKLNDWESIRKYHMSWRYNGEIITIERAKLLKSQGKIVIAPWKEIGYHFGIELDDESLDLKIKLGRPLSMAGAHTVGMNSTAIGICCVGNFDKTYPSPNMYYTCAEICKNMMKIFPAITIDRIFPHRQFAPKSCPGINFSMEVLKKYIINQL